MARGKMGDATKYCRLREDVEKIPAAHRPAILAFIASVEKEVAEKPVKARTAQAVASAAENPPAEPQATSGIDLDTALADLDAGQAEATQPK